MKTAKFLVVSLSVLLLLSVPLSAHAYDVTSGAAGVQDFIINDFSADETLSKEDPQGALHIVERIDVTFRAYNHGILRAIPASYKNHSLQLHVNRVSSASGAPSAYTTSDENGNTVLKIGNPDKVITGSQSYTIDYTLYNVISSYNDHDELYWDVNGDQWQQPFENVSVKLHLPSDLSLVNKPACFSGQNQSTTPGGCTISVNGNTVTAETTRGLYGGETLTYVVGFAKGYFVPPTILDLIKEYYVQILEFILPLLILGGGSIIYWWKRGRDAKGRGVIVPQYDAPEGLKPMAVGTIVDFKLDNKDITATIIDLAIHKYIKIVESKQAKLLRKDKTVYTLELLNPDFSKLDPNEIVLMTALFDDPKIGAVVDISAQKTKLYTTAQTLSKNIEATLTSQGYFKSNPLNAGKILGSAVFGIVILFYFIGNFISPILVVSLIISGIIMAICAHFLAARTEKGVLAREEILGLKMYLNIAEKDRLQKLQGPNAQYAANAGEPVKTVELFEKLLPYAMALGVEKQWAEQFQDLYNTPPSWYGGNWTTFNAVYLASALNDGVGSAVNGAFTPPSSSGSSGFGGGGFSGGGGGGGGGGGW